MRARLALRLVAIAIAIVAMIDPALSAREPAATPIVLIRLTAGSADAGADQTVARLRAALPGRDIIAREAAGPRVPCAPGERCVLIADGWIDVDVPGDAGLPLSLIRVPVSGSPNVAVRRVVVPAGVHATAAAAATVELSGAGVAGRRTEVRIMDGAATVGSSAIEWPATSSADATTATLEIPFWPMTQPGVVRVEVTRVPGETIVFDNAVDVGVPATDRVHVLIADTRPSWPSTFVRRALQDDGRFVVEYRSTIAPGSTYIAGSEGPAPRPATSEGLSEAALERAEVLIAGGIDGLSARDVALIDRFVRVRGGTAILLPDRPPSGEVARLMPGEWREQLMPGPERIGPLHASEILKSARPSATAIVLGAAAGEPAIVVEPRGEGRLIISGAMDAWRYRHLDEAAFDRFWRSIAADAGAASRALQIGLDRPLAANGARIAFTMRHRTMSAAAVLDARLFARCGEQAGRDVRAWPSGGLHVFTGEIPATAPGPCIVTAAANAARGDAAFGVAGRPVPAASETLRKLERMVIASGGVIADAGNEASIARTIAETAPPSLQAVTIHPMRSPWWIVPFAVCLSAEWWLRRRVGLR